ncbi:glycosyltransferase family 2 protein [Halorubrum ezzemoulense]|uniref:Glycosyltransferase family 2 protein n=1 Tax=Halorubrum ezzemoulense TaxID=337243 RepID=A0A256KB84_HALEZ|nr:glycosyltransferase family 2 protein [Halorubrum ezzemoulense]OYR78331.1 hypothetical protein DJ77_01160 [Halorubrum ezzemoulense]QAY21068.1 glycosyltransferase family 2 protein [Halorubrum ezzemoulense]
MTFQISVGVVLVNWNNYEQTRDCILSIKRQDIETTIYVVDNGSTDDSSERIKEKFQDINIIRNDRNLGFPTAANQGMNSAFRNGANQVFLVNNDAELQKNNSLRILSETLDSDEKIGIVSAQIFDSQGDYIWFRKGLVNWTTGASSHANSAGSITSGVTKIKQKIDDRFIQNEYVPLCAVMIDRNVYDEIGLLPEEYFLYFEDVEYCTKVLDDGFQIITDTQVNVNHDESASSGGRTSPTASYYTARNYQLFIQRHWDRVNRVMALMFYLWWITLLTCYRLLQKDWKSTIALWTGMFDGVQGHTGKGRYPKERPEVK